MTKEIFQSIRRVDALDMDVYVKSYMPSKIHSDVKVILTLTDGPRIKVPERNKKIDIACRKRGEILRDTGSREGKVVGLYAGNVPSVWLVQLEDNSYVMCWEHELRLLDSQ